MHGESETEVPEKVPVSLPVKVPICLDGSRVRLGGWAVRAAWIDQAIPMGVVEQPTDDEVIVDRAQLGVAWQTCGSIAFHAADHDLRSPPLLAKPPYAAGELADALGIDDGYVSRILKVLTEELMIEREPRQPVTAVDWEKIVRQITDGYRLLSSNETATWTAMVGPEQFLRDLAAKPPKRYAAHRRRRLHRRPRTPGEGARAVALS